MALVAQMEGGVAIRKFEMGPDGLGIGRAPDNDIVVDDALVSKKHAVIEAGSKAGEYFVRDLGSTNHTYVNGAVVEQRLALRNNDEITIGLLTLRFYAEHSDDLEATQEVRKSWIPGVYYARKKKT